VIFHDFPGPGILKKKIPGLSRRRGNSVYNKTSCISNEQGLASQRPKHTFIEDIGQNTSLLFMKSVLNMEHRYRKAI